MGLVKLAMADAAITYLWVIYIAFMRPVTNVIVSLTDLQGYEFHISMSLLALHIVLFSWLGGILGGALWNPTAVLAFYSMGMTNDSLFSMAVRFPAQTVGAVGGAYAAKELVPSSYKKLLRGPRLMVDPNTGILAELVLTFFMNFCILVVIFKGPNSTFLKILMMVLAAVVVVLLGAPYTGPSLNPAHAFAWAYVNDKHHSSEHVLVFWLAPLAGALMASWTFQLAFPKGRTKEKAA